jgi:hypothetical protein
MYYNNIPTFTITQLSIVYSAHTRIRCMDHRGLVADRNFHFQGSHLQAHREKIVMSTLTTIAWYIMGSKVIQLILIVIRHHIQQMHHV